MEFVFNRRVISTMCIEELHVEKQFWPSIMNPLHQTFQNSEVTLPIASLTG
jgi:hypothetical protein